MAFYQGREISLWPPRMGARPFGRDPGAKDIPNSEFFEAGTNRGAAGNDPQSSADGPVPEAEALAGNQLQNVASLPSIRLSSRPIAVMEGVDGPVNGSLFIVVTGHRDVTVGRGAACDLPIASNLLSRHHFRLRVSLTERTEKTGRGFLFELIDSGSSNGTFLNGTRLGNPTVLCSGDLIEAGDCGFRFFVLSATGEKKV